MHVTYIHSLDELAQGAPLLIYGAGGRGRDLLRAAERDGLLHSVAGFVDTFKSGTFEGLPVYSLEELKIVLARPELREARIVVASTYHRKIVRSLTERGLEACAVLLCKDEAQPLQDVPIRDIVAVLNTHRHPLRATCADMTGRLTPGQKLRCQSFSTIYFRPSGLSLCCWMPDLVEVPEPGDAASRSRALSRLDDIRHSLVQALDEGRNPYCANCPDAFATNSGTLPTQFTGLHLDVSTRCNLNCSYCIVKNTAKGVDYDFEALCDHALERGFVVNDPYFDWGGAGEPTLYPTFAERTQGLLRQGGHGLVYTNALKYSEVVAQGLAGRLRAVCSLDAGTRETYAAIRGVDGFDTVWTNIRHYVAAGAQNLTLKYIVTAQNAAPEEISAFVDRCREEGVKQVCISRDFYAETVSETERRALGRLAAECSAAGIGHHYLGTAVPQGDYAPGA
ncbi:MAG: hypothetical protein AUJ49_01025 [Desulfovibrionaceae bacterium CG1_02_65_16]|nr:MAG: hypothetical protein AUJ49_01025 [Desulfovibrionaceae bacterium CG1_02_65_16]